MGKPRISIADLKAWWAAGVPTEEMARRFGCHVTTVRNRAGRLGLPKRPWGGRRKGGAM